MAAFVEQTSTTDESGKQIYNTRNHPEDLRVYSSDAAIVPLAAWRRTASHPPPPDCSRPAHIFDKYAMCKYCVFAPTRSLADCFSAVMNRSSQNLESFFDKFLCSSSWHSRPSSKDIDRACTIASLIASVSWELTISAVEHSSAAPAKRDRMSTPESSEFCAAIYSFATRFMPSRNGVTGAAYAVGIAFMVLSSHAGCAPWASGTSPSPQIHLGRIALPNG
jgi:hypothetical protein